MTGPFFAFHARSSARRRLARLRFLLGEDSMLTATAVASATLCSSLMSRSETLVLSGLACKEAGPSLEPEGPALCAISFSPAGR